MAFMFGGQRQFDRPENVSINGDCACSLFMFLFDDNDGSLHWGNDQVMFKNTIYEITEGDVNIKIAPIFNIKSTDKTCVITLCAAGIKESEIEVRVEHLQDGSDVAVISGKSDGRGDGISVTYQHPRFQSTFTLSKNVNVGSMSKYFHCGLLIVSFDKKPE